MSDFSGFQDFCFHYEEAFCRAGKLVTPQIGFKIQTIFQVADFQSSGFILLPGLISPAELAEVCEEYDSMFERKKADGGRLEARWSGNWNDNNSTSSVLSIHNLQQHSSVFTKLLLHPAMLDSLEDLMQGSVVLHHTKAHLKPPKDGAPFPTHQDYHYFPYKKQSMLAVFIHLDDTDPENGGLGVFPGSHKQGPQTDASNTAGVHYLDQEQWPLSAAIPVHAKAGDVLVFSYLLVHGSYPNISDKTRRMFLIQVAEGSDLSTSGKHRSPGAGMVLRGTNLSMIADLDKRHEEGEEQEPK